MRIDDVKPAVLPNAVRLEQHFLGMHEPQPFDGSDGDPAYAWHLASVAVPGTGTKPSQYRIQMPAAPEYEDRRLHPEEMPRPPRNAYPGGLFHAGTRGSS